MILELRSFYYFRKFKTAQFTCMALLINAVVYPLCFYHCAGPGEEEDQCHLACVLLAGVVSTM